MGVIVTKVIAIRTIPVDKSIPVKVNTDFIITDGSQAINYLKLGSYDKTIFRVLNSLSPVALLPVTTVIQNELDVFNKYAEMYLLNQEVPVGFTELNNHLGSIGV